MTLRRADEREVHAIVYPPHNPDFVAPEGELPPFVAFVHGGPTGQSVPHRGRLDGLIALLHQPRHRRRRRQLRRVDRLRPRVPQPAARAVGRRRRRGHRGRRARAGRRRARRPRPARHRGRLGRRLDGAGRADDVRRVRLRRLAVRRRRADQLRQGHARLRVALPRRADRSAARGRASSTSSVRRSTTSTGCPARCCCCRASTTRSCRRRRPSCSATRCVRKGIPHAYRAYEGESHGFRKRETIDRRRTSRSCRSTARCSASSRRASRARVCRERMTLADVVEDGWAQALAPVAGQIAAMGDFLRAEVAAGRTYLPGRQEHPARVHPAVRRRPGADRRAGPVPDAGSPGRAVVLGRAGRAAGPALAAEHLPRAAHRPRPADAVQRRPDAVVAARRAAAEQVPDRRAGQAGVAPRQGLGGGHRPGDPRAGRPRRRRWSRSCGAATRSRWRRCSAASRASSRRTRRPMSADRGFFGSRPFSRANAALVGAGRRPGRLVAHLSPHHARSGFLPGAVSFGAEICLRRGRSAV